MLFCNARGFTNTRVCTEKCSKTDDGMNFTIYREVTEELGAELGLRVNRFYTADLTPPRRPVMFTLTILYTFLGKFGI